jgi:signal transduction histidine kinase/HD-like signal output (HDOD) protein
MAASGLQRRKIEVLLDKVDQLPTLPGVARRLLPLLVEEHLSRRDLQLALEVDATLAARVLRLAIAMGHSPDRLSSIDDLLEAVPPDVLAADLLSLEMIDETTLADLGLARLWRHVLATGMASQIIAGRLGTVSPAEALLAGILHDIGQVALATLMPRAYAQVLQRAAGEIDLVEAERELLSIDHAVLGRRLAARWGFSEKLQNVIWLHHQAQVPADTAGATLVGVVRLADLVARRQGYSLDPSEQVCENLAEAAERLGLSGASPDLIGQQIVGAFDLNAQQVGLNDQPDRAELWPALSAANARLGRLYRDGHLRTEQLQAQARRTDLLVRLNARIASCRTTVEVLEAAAASAHEALGLRVAAAYCLGRQEDYVEGIRCDADGASAEHFLYAVDRRQTLAALQPPAVASILTGVSAAAQPAEPAEGWLFERLGTSLGTGPFYTTPLSAGGRKIGGLIFALPAGARELDGRATGELAALLAVAGVAMDRVLAGADAVALAEELAEVNRRLQTAQDDQLRQRNVSSMGEMAAGAAHEINNPLAIISGRAQQLLAAEKEPARQDVLKTIIQQADRISGIIRDLRLFARPPAPVFQVVDAVGLARQAAAEFASVPDEEAPALRVEAAPAPALVRVDPQQIASALKELVQNAVEACSKGRGSAITVSVRPETVDGSVRITVADNGPGMDAKTRARAFDPFYCGHEAGRRRGMGLPKAFRAVHANGGRMTLESAPGTGTTVRLIFRAETPAQGTP